ncbi:transketolase-like TK C-terminal-containing protein [Roseococcus sp. DSY-14]|uniref:transketolase-like TK C-terminal-containing protein n=1 Tax=Roseococcus sp. DSY-14 TaxID=3369650 RepID=UPI00387A844A
MRARQPLPAVRRAAGANRSAEGAYVLREPQGGRDVTLLATGSEVALALAASDLLEAEGLRAAVVSMPCWALFEARPAAERAAVLGTAPRLGIEAAARLGWDRWTGEAGGFLGMAGYGASGAEADLWRHFGLTPADAARAAKALLAGPPSARTAATATSPR